MINLSDKLHRIWVGSVLSSGKTDEWVTLP